MKLLGIDFGLRKIGLALSDGLLVEPLTVIKNNSRTIKKIKNSCQQYRVEKIVIGRPESGIVQAVDRFAKRLNQDINLSVEYEEETLTSKEALAKMIEVGRGKRFRRKMEDAVAAAIILQNYLAKRGKTNV